MPDRNAKGRRVLIVSNRLPFTAAAENGQLTFKESAGGLATGLRAYLDSLQKTADYVWVGWPGATLNDEALRDELRTRSVAEFHAYPVFLSEKEMDNFYHGFCNSIIWPLFHYFPSYVRYEKTYWEHYKSVNQCFCEAVMEIIQPDDVVWIHDYQLMLLPQMIRERMPEANIGFFLHIPFPSFELFRLLPHQWGAEILQGLLGADLVGFHTHDYTQYFITSVLRILGYDHNMGEILAPSRVVKADTFPMGIDFEAFQSATISPEVQRERATLTEQLPPVKIVLSLDRLDYTKGIINRLQSFALFLEQYPEWRRRVILALMIVPSRTGVEQYKQTKRQVEELVGRINGQFGTLDWVPIVYQYRSWPFPSLVGLYGLSDVGLVTPLRDGMNLIAKEYIASRADKTGVLVLSEMAGAAQELGEAIRINPNSREEIAAALKEALEMPQAEQIKRNQKMLTRLRRYNVVSWAKDFMRGLDGIKTVQNRLNAKVLRPAVREELVGDYARAGRRLLFLDYDGTLVPFAPTPQEARPPAALLDLLTRLGADPANEVVLVSGRDKDTLQNWFGALPVGLIAEHGLWLRRRGEDWRMLRPLAAEWKPRIRPLLEMYVDRLPGSFVEEKTVALVWHYRKAEPQLASIRAKELLEHLTGFTANIDVQILQGNKVIEVKSAGVNKGAAALHWIGEEAYDFLLALGDDWTDEDLFRVLSDSAYSIKVGLQQSYARFNFRDRAEVGQLLADLAQQAAVPVG
jgi:trehalose 6-phosphate synthase/phosphatase